MSLNFRSGDHRDWEAYGLKDYGEFAEKIHEFNQKDLGDCTKGEFYYIPDEPHTVEDQGTFRVIYRGDWGNYHSPGSSITADLYDVNEPDDMKEFEAHVAELKASPEWLPSEDDEEEEDEEAELDSTMHQHADNVAEALRAHLTQAALDGMDCDDILSAGKEWLGEDNDDVKALAAAIKAYDEYNDAK